MADEAHYVTGAVALAEAVSGGRLEAFTGASLAGAAPTTYPAGTALVQAPFVWAFGWRAAAVASVAAFGLVGVLLYRWLLAAGRHPGWVWLWFGFPPALVMARLAMSDMPGTACVAVGLSLCWGATQGRLGRAGWFFFGLTAGLAVLFREPLALALGPFVAGSVVRRDAGRWLACAGLVSGLAVRGLVHALVYGSPVSLNPISAGFTLAAVAAHLPLYALLLLVLLPGGLVAVAGYRGWRWPECQLAVWLTLGLYLPYGYTAFDAPSLQQVVLVGRFVVPIVPIVIWCTAWAAPGAGRRLLGRGRVTAGRLQALARVGGAVGAMLLVLVHPVVARWDRAQAAVAADLQALTPPGAALLATADSAVRYLPPRAGGRRWLAAWQTTADELAALERAGTRAYLVSAGRTDSELFREDREMVEEYRLRLAAGGCTLGPPRDVHSAPGFSLLVQRVGPCGPVRGTLAVSP